jgi:hypothetical protein
MDSMKKKQPKRKQKIDVVLESLLNLERVVKGLVAQIEQLRYSQSRFKDTEIDSKKYWPNTEPPFKYKDIMWNDNSSSQWDAIDKGLQ